MLHGAFLALHIHDPQGRNPYEADLFFGRTADKGVVVHWLDGTGGETSRTLGIGTETADALSFTFPYPGGTFYDRLSYDAAHDRWRLLIDKESGGHRTPFSDWFFDRAAK